MVLLYRLLRAKAGVSALLKALLLLIAISACSQDTASTSPAAQTAVVELPQREKTVAKQVVATYVGSATCANCHEQAVQQWQSSHHALAMQVASEETVLGDFDNRTVSHLGEDFTFFRDEQAFLVRTKNQDGKLQVFEIDYAFGVEPLQQYLIDVGNGAYQALSMAWDSRPPEQGGQRWYHLYPDEAIRPSDPLHWTRLHQNWNFQCADCHSTNLQKRYDSETRSYDTRFSELNVACESCHGPASAHLDWASEPNTAVAADDELPTSKGFAADLSSSAPQIDSCARCHSRRRTIAEEFAPGEELYDHYVPALLEPGLYHADGQILEEVYVYGSFVQSKMHQAGVKCSNCHEPHTAKLRLEGNAVCTQCHQATPPDEYAGLTAKRYDSPEHHFHPMGSGGAQCRQCHMPAKTYMGVDERYDHSFRIPQPAHNASIQAPDVCTDCHEGKTTAWAQKVLDAHYPDSNARHSFGAVFYAARQGQANYSALADIANNNALPDIVRASALAHMEQPADEQSFAAAQSALSAENPGMRLAAARLFEPLPVSQRWQIVSPLLTDPVLAVRIEAARILADAPEQFLQNADKQALQRALDEFVASQMLNADRPDAQSNLASVAARRGGTAQAERHYQEAIALDPSWVPAYLNLADLYRGNGRDKESEPLFTTALVQQPGIAETHHAYGLWLSRQGRAADSLQQLKQAAALSDSWRYAYVYAIGLNSSGDGKQAIAQLKALLGGSQRSPEILFALSTILRDQGQREQALNYALALAEQYPGDPRAAGLIQQLR